VESKKVNLFEIGSGIVVTRIWVYEVEDGLKNITQRIQNYS
jgi:hypothetical protein